MAEELKYGYRHGPAVCVPVTMAASQETVAQSGKFIYMNDGAATLCDDSITTIFGHLEQEADSSTAAEVRNCNISLLSVFRIPVVGGTFVIGMVGEVCDIDILSTIQGAALDASEHDIITVVGGSAAVYVDVMMTPREWNNTTGTDA